MVSSSENGTNGTDSLLARIDPKVAGEGNKTRLVCVRYFLDRPGYGLENSACRLWFNPPAVCQAHHVSAFLAEQGISLPGLLTEIYLDRFQSFMMLDICAESSLEWNFTNTTHAQPGTLNVRLTDLSLDAHEETAKRKESSATEAANTTPVGLFAFSFVVGLEVTALTTGLIDDSVDEAFHLIWAPYAFFIGGVLQFVVGLFQVPRGNIYGATAFLAFGCFWMANGTSLILQYYFATPDTQAGQLLGVSDPWGNFIRQIYILLFACTLLKQTLVMDKLSTTVITILCVKLVVTALTGWSEVFEWMDWVMGWMLSGFAFYVFVVELTNQVYSREVFRTFKWSEEHSPQEVFGAEGQAGTLQSKALLLRRATIPNIRLVREAKKDL